MSNPSFSREPIAIIGIGCRFPGGADHPAAFWDMLVSGRDAITEIPEDRWSLSLYHRQNRNLPGKTYARHGAFLNDIDHFDAEFFGISPREATRMDPQQRLLLELAWEAFEDAGLPPDALSGSQTGVYVGISTFEYYAFQSHPDDYALIDAHSSTGAVMSIAANRLSYAFDLRGPSVSMDTACSSSLVAVHHACESIWFGECDMALACGVQIIYRPEGYIMHSKASMLSPSGRCHAFDARADGFVRGEGGGVVVLKPLASALANQDPIYAVIRGSALNQDGRTNSLTMPSEQAQIACAQTALCRAGVAPHLIQYVEAHGPGTPVGDPIEARALGTVLGVNRTENCVLGSVKTNIGHLEAAAGMAGLIKLALALKHRRIPPNAGFETPNPDIPLPELRLRIPAQAEPWPANREGAPRLAGINSFGFGGANAHLVLSEAPQTSAPTTPPQSGDHLLVLSARSEQALAALARSHQSLLKTSTHALSDICYSASVRRTHHPHRLTVTAPNAREMATRLDHFLNHHPGIFRGRAEAEPHPLVFVCSGMGQQWPKMGRDLFAAEPVFRQAFLSCADALDPGWSLADAFSGKDMDIDRTEIAQVMIFAIQIGLAALWKSWGIIPHAIVGHSVGEIAAAHLAGALSLKDAMQVVHHRSRLQAKTAGQGAMLAVGLSEADMQPLIQGQNRIAIAAVNSPKSITLAGCAQTLRTLSEKLGQKDIFNRFLRVEVPYHSPLMEPLVPQLEAALSGIIPKNANIPLYSTVTGRRILGPALNGAYWAQNMRAPVRFADAIFEMAREMPGAAFLELSAHPVLGYALNECLPDAPPSLYSLRREQPERAALLANLSRLYCLGHKINWWGFHPNASRYVPLPLYPWQRARHWMESETNRRRRLGATDHPLLGRRLPLPQPTWETEIDLEYLPYLRDHRIHGDAVYPATAYLEGAMAAARAHLGDGVYALSDVVFDRSLILDENRIEILHTALNDTTVDIHSRTGSGEWVQHMTCRVTRLAQEAAPAPLDLEAIRRRCPNRQSGETCYQRLAQIGYDYGPSFQGAHGVWSGETEALFELRLPEGLTGLDAYHVHPAVSDAYANGVLSVLVSPRTWIPVRFGEITICQKPAKRAFLHMRLIAQTDRHLHLDLTLTDEAGQPGIVFRGLHYQALQNDRRDADPDQCVYRDTWQIQPPANAIHPAHCLIFADRESIANALSEHLSVLGAEVACIYDRDLANPDAPSSYQQALARVPSADHIICLWGITGSPEPFADQTDLRALFLTQALADDKRPRHLWLVTRRAWHIDAHTAPAHTTLWGLGRVIANEYPHLHPRLIDLGENIDSDALAREILSGSDETEVALRGKSRYVRRLQSLSMAQPAKERPFSLTLTAPGSLEHLRFEHIAIPQPGPGEVAIEIRATGLNFKDIVKTLGMIDAASLGQTLSGDALGFECAGRIVAIGEGVSGFQPGDAVIAIASGCFGTHTRTRAGLVAHKPETLCFEEAATLPVAYLTAYSALCHFGQLQSGERVLIHSASGGVGQAAIHIAKALGAEIFATAGSPEKRAFLKSLNIAHILDSRTLAFADHILQITQDKGVDLVLNALPPRTLSKSLSTLRPRGRFIDLSNFYTGAQVDLRPFQKGLSLIAFDLDQLMQTDPAFVDDLFQEAMTFVHSQNLPPLSHRVFPISNIQDAFRLMALAQHIGKIVVSIDTRSEVPVHPSHTETLSLNPRAAYLVTGGLRGFGLATAQWLVSQGARHLVLVGRSGASTPESQRAVAEWEAGGVTVQIVKADVSDFDAMQRVINAIALPLRGIVHAATVYEDCVLSNMTAKRYHQPMKPKVQGAWNLHLLTRDLPLDFFVMYSSIAAIVGSPGQGNYSAANAFLDGLADHRRALNLPVLSVNWGAIGEVGYLSRATDIGRRFEQWGMVLLPPDQAFTSLGALLAQGAHRAVVAPVKWPQISRRLPGIRAPKFRDCVGDVNMDIPDEETSPEELLTAAAPEARFGLTIDFLRLQVAQVLGIAPGDLDVQKPLTGLGLDSLLAVELSQRLMQRLSFDISPMKLLGDLTMRQIAENIATALPSAQADTAPVAPASPAPEISPLSPLQMPVWSLHKLKQRSPFFNLPHRVHFQGRLDVEALTRSLRHLVERHQILNTLIRETEEGPVLAPAPGPNIAIPLQDLSALPVAEREAAVQRIVEEERVWPIDLSCERPVRAQLMRLGLDEYLLVANLHHIAGDGTSIRQFFTEWFAFYRADVLGTKPDVPALPMQYADFSRKLHKAIQSGAMDTQRDFWRTYLDGRLPALHLPLDFTRPAEPSLRGQRHRFGLPKPLGNALRQLAQKEQSTLFMALLSGLSLLVHRETRQTDFCLGTFPANRNRADVQNLIGCFVNAVPIRIDLSGDPTIQKVLGRIRQSTLQALAHADLPFSEIRRVAPPDWSAPHPAVQVVLILHTEFDRVYEYHASLTDDLNLTLRELDNGGAKRDWTFHFFETPDGLSGYLEYDADLFTPETIARAVATYQILLEKIAGHPDMRLRDLISQTER